MRCANCGRDVPDGMRNCPNCGVILSGSPVNQSGSQQGMNGYQNGYQNGMGYQNGIPNGQGGAGMAIASMVCGICSVVFGCCFYYVSWIIALVGLILGAIALKKQTRGKGMAIAGLTCSIVGLAFFVIMLLTAGALIASTPFASIY